MYRATADAGRISLRRSTRPGGQEHPDVGAPARAGRAAVLAAAALLLVGGTAKAQVVEGNFRGGRTTDLAALCAASGQEALGGPALGYCQGFIVSAGQYHRALTAEGGAQRPIFCLPNPSPSFDQFRLAFVAWARGNPQHGTEPAIDGLARFAAATYPCLAAPAAPPRR